MNLTDLRPADGAHKKTKRVGRGHGSGHGKTATRGYNGQGQRSGESKKVGFEGGQKPLFRRLPKKHHFTVVDKAEYAIVNVGALSKFAAGTTVTPELLVEQGLIKQVKDGVRVLGEGELAVKLTVQATHITEGARRKIEAAGGTAEEVS